MLYKITKTKDSQSKEKKYQRPITKLRYEHTPDLTEDHSERILELTSENNNLKRTNDELTKLIMEFQKEQKSLKNIINQLQNERDMNNKEKVYISKDILDKKEKVDKFTKENNELRKQIMELQRQNKKLVSEVNYEKGKEYIENLQKSKDLLEKKEKKFLEEIQELHEIISNLSKNKNEVLQQQNIELKNKVKEIENKPIVDDSYIIEQYKKQINELRDEVNLLKMQSKIKSDDNQRMNNFSKENLETIKELYIENNSLKEKLKVFKEQVNYLTVQNADEINKYKAAIAILKEKNKENIAFEDELNQIFYKAAVNFRPENAENMPLKDDKRQQILMLSDEIKALKEENENLKKNIIDLKDKNSLIQTENDLTKKHIVDQEQPYEFLVKKLAEKDEQILYYEDLLKSKDIEVKNMRRENDLLNENYLNVSNDLKTLLSNRDKINQLDYYMGKIMFQQNQILGENSFNASEFKQEGKRVYSSKTNKKY